MLERRRVQRGYGAVAGDDDAAEDVELGEGVGPAQEEGIVSVDGGKSGRTLEQEVDNWDENAVDEWDEGDDGDVGGSSAAAKGKGVEENGDSTKRAD
jgi:hypothetical protein